MFLKLAFFNIVIVLAESRTGYLSSTRRFSDDTYDYYFYCSGTCTAIEWRNDNLDIQILSHGNEDELSVGYVKFAFHEHVNCTSLILEKTQSNNVTALLLLHFDVKQVDVNVSCRCNRKTGPVEIDSNRNCPDEKYNSSVIADLIVSDTTLLPDFNTSIFMCEGNQSLFWVVNNEFVANITSRDMENVGVGNTVARRNREVIYTRTLQLDSNPLIVLLIWNYNYSEIEDPIYCKSYGGDFKICERDLNSCPDKSGRNLGATTQKNNEATSETTVGKFILNIIILHTFAFRFMNHEISDDITWLKFNE